MSVFSLMKPHVSIVRLVEPFGGSPTHDRGAAGASGLPRLADRLRPADRLEGVVRRRRPSRGARAAPCRRVGRASTVAVAPSR